MPQIIFVHNFAIILLQQNSHFVCVTICALQWALHVSIDSYGGHVRNTVCSHNGFSSKKKTLWNIQQKSMACLWISAMSYPFYDTEFAAVWTWIWFHSIVYHHKVTCYSFLFTMWISNLWWKKSVVYELQGRFPLNTTRHVSHTIFTQIPMP